MHDVLLWMVVVFCFAMTYLNLRSMVKWMQETDARIEYLEKWAYRDESEARDE